MPFFKTRFRRDLPGLLITASLAVASVLAACSAAAKTPSVGATLPVPATLPATVTVRPTTAPTLDPSTKTPTVQVTADPSVPAYRSRDLPLEQRLNDLMSRLSQAEKIGQMTQIEIGSLRNPALVADLLLGSALSGGDGAPSNNNPSAWVDMINRLQQRALDTRLGVPLLYGIDAVHGLGGVNGATVFPHNIALGAAADPGLVERIGQATAREMAALGIRWNFAPVLASAQDIRWGRTYESYSENPALVAALGEAYVRGLSGGGLGDPVCAGRCGPAYVLATPKHYIGDGGTTWASSKNGDYKLDQGDTRLDEAALRATHLAPYIPALKAGALSVMASFSSWNGTKMHANKYLLTDVLKGELGFKGFVVSDWAGIDQLSSNYSQAVISAINAGIDMNMVPTDGKRFINTLTQAVQDGLVPQARINDAVRRILSVKLQMGLFELPLTGKDALAQVGSAENRKLAAEAVQKSLVLLKNEGGALPLAKSGAGTIFVAGQGASDIGMQCGGWTIVWQGKSGNITAGTTILKGIETLAGAAPPRADGAGRVQYNRTGRFDGQAEVGIVVVGEQPYAEGLGDKADLSLSAEDLAVVNRVRPLVKKLVVIVLSGRPLVVNPALQVADAFVAAWLPGSEGAAVADVLFGDVPFSGKLPFRWPKSIDQLPFGPATPTEGAGAPLFPAGFGLR